MYRLKLAMIIITGPSQLTIEISTVQAVYVRNLKSPHRAASTPIKPRTPHTLLVAL